MFPATPLRVCASRSARCRSPLSQRLCYLDLGIGVFDCKLLQQAAIQPPVSGDSPQSIGDIDSLNFRDFRLGRAASRSQSRTGAASGGFAHRAIAANRASGSIGFVMWSFIPACRQRSRSSTSACAVMATMGRSLNLGIRPQ